MPSERAGPHPSARRVRPYYYEYAQTIAVHLFLGRANRIHEVHPWQSDSLS
jgi:hypothetical protein